jgi:DNA-binding XRE family transcriptional regulator
MNGTLLGADHVHEGDRPKDYGPGRTCSACDGPVNRYEDPVNHLTDILLCCGCWKKVDGYGAPAVKEYLASVGRPIEVEAKPARRWRDNIPLPSLKVARTHKCRTLEQLAKASGIPASTIHYIEQGKRNVSPDRAAVIAEALGVSLRTLKLEPR